MSGDFKPQAHALIVQRHQTGKAQDRLREAYQGLEALEMRGRSIQDDLDNLLAQAESAIAEGAVLSENISIDIEITEIVEARPPLDLLDHVDLGADGDWQAYLTKIKAYSTRNELTLPDDPFADLLSPTQRIKLEKRIKDEFSLKNANCDKYDYMIAGTCGVIGGLLDVFFVGRSEEGAVSEFANKMTDDFVQKFSEWCGFKGAEENFDNTESAISFFDRIFRMNYDEASAFNENGADTAFHMSNKMHYIKRMSHYRNIIGLFFSILDQFTSEEIFFNGNSIIRIDTNTYDLIGSTMISKIYAGFINWFSRFVASLTESSGAEIGGAGIPIPFFDLLQFLQTGEFGLNRQSFATIAVQVFKREYDFRQGKAMAIPVLITELLTGVMWTFKRKYQHDLPWNECLPSASNPELRRMLLVGHGTLCIIDGTDAAIRSGGQDLITFLLRINFIGWARFGTLALKELQVWYRSGGLDIDAVDEYLEAEYRRILA